MFTKTLVSLGVVCGAVFGVPSLDVGWGRALPLSIDEVIDLAQRGISADSVTSVMKEEGIGFVLTDVARQKLRKAGVGDEVMTVIEQMVPSSDNAPVDADYHEWSGEQQQLAPQRRSSGDTSHPRQGKWTTLKSPYRRQRGQKRGPSMRKQAVEEGQEQTQDASLVTPEVFSSPVAAIRTETDQNRRRTMGLTTGAQTWSAPTNESALDAGEVVDVPAGEFWMRCNPRVDDNCETEETPGYRSSLGTFHIDRTEVTVDRYRRCVEAGVCSPPERYAVFGSSLLLTPGDCNWGRTGVEQHPINCVTWHEAHAYCRWVGKRLPTNAEWEKAARGTDGRVYPWGNASDATRANVASGGTTPVSVYPAGASPYGALDMSGGLSEWVGAWYNPGDDDPVARGGSWGDTLQEARVSAPFPLAKKVRGHAGYLRDPRIGFRCAK